jgi:peptidoglycan/LPS O-acetylase OafA/YrhL
MSNTNRLERWWAIVSILLGLVVLQWQWILNMIGLPVHVERADSPLAFEYWLGLLGAGFLGYIFPKRAALAGLLLMLGPTFIVTVVYLAESGVPALWPIQMMFTVVLTIPYIICAALAAYFKQRRERVQNAT